MNYKWIAIFENRILHPSHLVNLKWLSLLAVLCLINGEKRKFGTWVKPIRFTLMLQSPNCWRYVPDWEQLSYTSAL